MAELTLLVCDVCGDPDVGTTHYEVRGEGQRYAFELCDRDAEPLKLLMQVIGPVQRKSARQTVRTSRRSPLRVKTMEEIEALKRR